MVGIGFFFPINSFCFEQGMDNSYLVSFCAWMNEGKTNILGIGFKDGFLFWTSAGCGRSGSFIAVHYLYEEAEKERKINFFNCVKSMRQERVNMVQTPVSLRLMIVKTHNTISSQKQILMEMICNFSFLANLRYHVYQFNIYRCVWWTSKT